jgi:DNA invertase Pin-like site-specific DNA recombinase
MTTVGCHAGGMTDTERQQAIERLIQVRAEALEHARKARDLAGLRRDLIQDLIKDGMSQSDVAREMGVSRQAVQKMLSVS